MRWKSGCSIAGPFLRLNIDGANINVLRGTILNAAAHRKNAEGISVRIVISAGLVFETAYSAKNLRVGANTIPAQQRKPWTDKISILANIRRCKNVDLVYICFKTNSTP